MSTISSITELLNLSNVQFRIFDIGRRVSKISKETFSKVEENQLPHPFPHQGHAHLAIAFWQGKEQSPYLWFAKLPLDERGLLNLGARNHFVAIIVEALGTDLSADPTEKQAELLQANPYIFEPSQYKLAFLHSLISASLKQPASSYYQPAIDYLIKKDWQNWQNIGVQGLTDLAVRFETDNLTSLVSDALPHLPKKVLAVFSGALENVTLPHTLCHALLNMQSQSTLDNEAKLLYFRALSCSQHDESIREFIKESLNNEKEANQEFVITIAGRFWESLENEATCLAFLELVAGKFPELFAPLFRDLVAIPGLRAVIFANMRNEQRSEELGKAIGALFNQQ